MPPPLLLSEGLKAAPGIGSPACEALRFCACGPPCKKRRAEPPEAFPPHVNVSQPRTVRTSGGIRFAGSALRSTLFRLRAAVQAGTRVRMSLGAKSRGRRRPKAGAGGHSPPRAFAPATTDRKSTRLNYSP